MTNKQLFNGINGAHDKFIIEAIEDDDYLYRDVERKHRFGRVLKAALPCAACAALIFGAVVGGRYFGGNAPVSPSDVSTASVVGSHHFSGNPPVSPPDGSTASDISAAVSESSSTSVNTETSSNIVQNDPELNGMPEPATPDPAAFWDGELPVLPVKEITNEHFKPSLDIERCWVGYFLETKRGSAVYAVADGEVSFVGERSLSSGRSVVIKHSDTLYTCYDNLEVDCGVPVRVGDTVKAGQVIGYSGMRLGGSEFLNGIVYRVYTYDPLREHYIGATERINEWKNSGLAKPLDNVSGDFDFGNMSFLISRDEPVIPAPEGANVYAADSGVVVKATDYGGGLGYFVAVMHGFDDISAGVTCVYYHLGDLTVKEGDTVERGELIGHVSGSSFSGVSGLGYGIESWVSGSHHMIASDDPEAVNVLIPKWWD